MNDIQRLENLNGILTILNPEQVLNGLISFIQQTLMVTAVTLVISHEK